MHDVHTIDPAGQNLRAEAERLAALGPAARVMLPGGVPAWSITSDELIRSLLTDDRVSKDARHHWPAFIEGRITPEWSLYAWVAVTNMFTAYGGDHRRLRRLVAPAFTARRTESLRARVQGICAELVDGLWALPAGTVVDLREQLAQPLPLQVICELLGVPVEVRPDLGRAVDGVFATGASPEAAAANYRDLYRVLTELVASKREYPGDDLTSDLVAARDGDEDTGSEGLSEEELLDTLLLILSAGYETTVHLIGNAVHALLTHPSDLARVRSSTASWEDAVEETLRWAPSVAHLPLRFAVEDIAVPGGDVIRAGDAIMVSYAAAGWDLERFGEDAGRFDLTRADKDHLAFGYGVHRCLGAPLARMEAGIALSAVFEAFPNLRLAVRPSELKPVDSFISHGFQALPVVLR